MFKHYQGLKEAGERWEWLQEMLVKVLENSLRPSAKSGTRLGALLSGDGRIIGKDLAVCLVSNATSEAAVAEWIGRHKALTEMDMRYTWFRPMMNKVASHLLAEATLGARMRLFAGAALSTVDMATDLSISVRYLTEHGQEGLGCVRERQNSYLRSLT